MDAQCYRKKDSDPALCGVHHVPLVQRQSSDDLRTFRLGDFEFLVCPVSGEVVGDAET